MRRCNGKMDFIQLTCTCTPRDRPMQMVHCLRECSFCCCKPFTIAHWMAQKAPAPFPDLHICVMQSRKRGRQVIHSKCVRLLHTNVYKLPVRLLGVLYCSANDYKFDSLGLSTEHLSNARMSNRSLHFQFASVRSFAPPSVRAA